MDPIAAQQPGTPGPRRSRLGRGVLATAVAVAGLGVGAVGAWAGGGSDASAAQDRDASAPAFVQESTPDRPADPQPRGDEPCPERDGSGGSQEQGSGGSGSQAPDASDAAVF